MYATLRRAPVLHSRYDDDPADIAHDRSRLLFSLLGDESVPLEGSCGTMALSVFRGFGITGSTLKVASLTSYDLISPSMKPASPQKH